MILDLMLPGISGYDVLAELRKREETREVGVILLTARREETDRIRGLSLGADDYLTKPFSPQELSLRVGGLLRRLGSPAVSAGSTLTAGPISIDRSAHRATMHGEELNLTATEYKLLLTLVERRGRVQTRPQLLEIVWEAQPDIQTRTVDMHVQRLRTKLGEAGKTDRDRARLRLSLQGQRARGQEPVTFVKRLVLGSVLILVLTVGILLWVAERSLRRDLEGDIGHNLESEATLVREALPADSAGWHDGGPPAGRQTRHRITLIDRDGWVRADSDFPSGSATRHRESRRPARGSRGAGRRPGRGPPPERDGRTAAALRRHSRRARRGAGRRRAGPGGRSGPPGAAGGGRRRAARTAGREHRSRCWRAARSPSRWSRSAPPPAPSPQAAAPFPRSGIPDIDGLVQALRQMHQQLGDRFDELRREQAETAALVESMVEGVIAADERGRIVTANAAARRLLGYAAGRSASRPAGAVPGQGGAGGGGCRARGPAGAGPGARDGRRRVPDECRARCPSGGAVLVIHDLTEMRRLEAVRRDFVANVSHELKTPLTSISGYAETLLTDTPEPDTTRRFLRTILNNARRMQRLVDDLLDLATHRGGSLAAGAGAGGSGGGGPGDWSGLAERAAARAVQFDVDVGARADRRSMPTPMRCARCSPTCWTTRFATPRPGDASCAGAGGTTPASRSA